MGTDLRYDNALSAAQHSLAIRERVLDPDEPAIAVSLNELALAYYAKREFTKAEPLAKRAVLINERPSDADSKALACRIHRQVVSLLLGHPEPLPEFGLPLTLGEVR